MTLTNYLLATAMLTLAALVVAIVLRCVANRSAVLRQWILLAALLNGLMLIRIPIDVPVLPQEPQSTFHAEVTRDERLALPPLLPSGQAMAEGHTTRISAPALDRSSVVSWPSKRLLTYGFALIWFLGVMVIFLRSCLAYMRLCRSIADLPNAPTEWCAQWRRAFRMTMPSKISNSPVMLVSDQIGPMLVRQPSEYALVVPRDFWESLPDQERLSVLLHEAAHLQRHDVWWQAFVRMIALMHWWNPASWWCVRKFEEASEWACDAALLKVDCNVAHGLARSLVRFIEHTQTASPTTDLRGLGVQSMAGPPITKRVQRLLHPDLQEDSVMKKTFVGCIAIGLIVASIVYLHPVAAHPDDSWDRPTSNGIEQKISSLRSQLDTDDELTAKLAKALDSEHAAEVLSHAVEDLRRDAKALARSEAIPHFLERHFTEDEDGELIVREDSSGVWRRWTETAKAYDEVLAVLSNEMQDLASQIKPSSEADRLAQRMLRDAHSALVLTIEEFDGRIDPVERFLGELANELFVEERGKLVARREMRQDLLNRIDLLELAVPIATRLAPQLRQYAEEFATHDERHDSLVQAMDQDAFAAMIAMDVADNEPESVAVAIDRVFENIDEATRHTSEGLIIDGEESWPHLNELIEVARRAEEQTGQLRTRVDELRARLDTQDPMTKRLADLLGTDAMIALIASELPASEFDVTAEVTSALQSVMEPVGDNRLSVQESVEEDVIDKASEVLKGCVTVRRYLGRIETAFENRDATELLDSLGPSGRLVLLNQIRLEAEQSMDTPLDAFVSMMLIPASQNNSEKWIVRREREDAVNELARRCEELDATE